jgi:hypothetical protein
MVSTTDKLTDVVLLREKNNVTWLINSSNVQLAHLNLATRRIPLGDSYLRMATGQIRIGWSLKIET